MTTNNILTTIDDNGVATVTLNNPEKHNAFDDIIIANLTETFESLATNDSIRVVVLASTGKSFSAGADLNWMKRMAAYDYDANLTDANALANMLKTLNFLPKTTIAKIQGAAYGGAVGLASCCDIVVASERASFCLSEVKLGLIPATISPYVVDAMGVKKCRRLFQTAERFSATQAHTWGLVDDVVTIGELDNQVEHYVKQVLANGPLAVRAAKQLTFDVSDSPINQTLIDYTSEQIAAIRVSNEGQQGLNAFFSKQAPNWQMAYLKEQS